MEDSKILLSQLSYYQVVEVMESEMGKILVAWLFGALFLMFMYCFKRSRDNASLVRFPMLYMDEVGKENYLLDLPDLALDSILMKLSPANLSRMSRVSTTLRGMCTSDHLWERHLKRKWGGLIGNLAYKEWQWSIASRKHQITIECSKKVGLVASFWSNKSGNRGMLSSTLPVDSIMALYLSLETGKFWFPAQVFNRENGHVGFLLSCYDAELSYNRFWGNFRARFSSEGRPTLEPNIDWTRLRAPAVEAGPHTLHPSDCLDYLKPGDHIEIQWKRTRHIPYGWWYGVVGHLEPGERCRICCECHRSDKVVLEFNQYDPGSRWRETIIRRSNHREIGDGLHGFYGGIRKLYNKYEISMWQQQRQPEAM